MWMYEYLVYVTIPKYMPSCHVILNRSSQKDPRFDAWLMKTAVLKVRKKLAVTMDLTNLNNIEGPNSHLLINAR